MKRLERVVVQLVEARRMAELHDEPHTRIALLLIDNVVETLLYRESEYLLGWESMYAHIVSPFGEAKDLPPELAELRSQVTEAVSKTQRRRIEREFDAKANYLVRKGLVDATTARAFKKLHQYRNEAYHRDEIRQETLETAVGIYFWLACQLFAALPPHSLEILTPLPKGLQPFAPEGPFKIGFKFPKEVAEQLLDDFGLHDNEVCGLLSEHLLSRIEGIRENLQFIAEDNMSGRDLDPAEVLHTVQIENDLGAGWLDPEVIRAQRVAFGMSDLDRWEHRSREVANLWPMLIAFGEFADIEDEFEPLEHKVADAAYELDRAIDLQIDIARGK